MEQDNAIKNFKEEIGKLFGVDYIEILPINKFKFKVNAIIMSPNTIINFYKLFNSFINEIERADNDAQALRIFKQNLLKYKKQFDILMDKIQENIVKVFGNNAEVSLIYKGQVKEIYDKVSQFVK